ncbi:hypothetical protein XENTR_v10021281 [Xenopus tropicalis]|uniref:Lymphotoxin-beta n=1 Tax=Xenopus tropicalis TaxID=8364 RepID=F6WJ69_XENTR|nr:lymphotoxin-beta [Xenopus tropicalis]KAE8585337.1 hypothetical protein XENTR_v10021281 [Xenopus tropicalis]CAJ14376.1 lymphotoxin-beta [Xenopus tropicalis]|eukprot:NP_001107163.1 lymphotoxin-beta [Xenopus tropicalis]
MRDRSRQKTVIAFNYEGTDGKPQRGKQVNNWQKRNANKSAAHLVGIIHGTNKTLRWKPTHELSFIRPSMKYADTNLIVHRDGLYYVYCQVGFYGKVPNIVLFNHVIIQHDSDTVTTLLSGTESVVGPPPGSSMWYATLAQGGLAKLKSGDHISVIVSHPDLIYDSDGMTFFGLIMVS